jgi:hypothetical protein
MADTAEFPAESLGADLPCCDCGQVSLVLLLSAGTWCVSACWAEGSSFGDVAEGCHLGLGVARASVMCRDWVCFGLLG